VILVSAFKRLIGRSPADALMSGIVLIWGMNFIVMKDGLSDVAPLTYNALRFTVALPLLMVIALQDRSVLHIAWRDLGLIGAATIIGPLGYQLLFISGLDRTTSTNTALLVATSPAWTAIISILIGMVMIHRRLLIGLGLTLSGVVLVILSRTGIDGLSLGGDDVIGGLLVLGAAVFQATGNVLKKPLVDRLGGMRVSLWSYWIMVIGLLVAAGPDLLRLSPGDVPLRSWPNIAYSGLLAGVGGFTTVNYALKELGPTRTSTYYNFTPIIASSAGVLILGDRLTPGLVIGGALTLWGVLIVRSNIYLRKTPVGSPVD
jgi:drug/metabolite transporter (DMT)-like permease